LDQLGVGRPICFVCRCHLIHSTNE
jgi:hypothetical protein